MLPSLPKGVVGTGSGAVVVVEGTTGPSVLRVRLRALDGAAGGSTGKNVWPLIFSVMDQAFPCLSTACKDCFLIGVVGILGEDRGLLISSEGTEGGEAAPFVSGVLTAGDSAVESSSSCFLGGIRVKGSPRPRRFGRLEATL